MTAHRGLSLIVLVVASACGSGKSGDPAPLDGATSDGPIVDVANVSDAPEASGPACPTAYQRVTAASSGHELAVAYREHVPTHAEQATAAAIWAMLIRAVKEGKVDQPLFERLFANNPLANVPALYPTAFRACTPASTITATTRGVISNPFQCTDDCMISLDEFAMFLTDPLVNALKALGALSPVLGESLQLTDAIKAALADPALAGMAIQDIAAQAVSQASAQALLANIFDALGQSAAVTAAVIELAGAGEVAGVIGAVGSIIGLGVYAARLTELAARINACRAWKLENCRCMGPNCGCADLGESARGVMCCAQGGPTADGGWYVNTASPTCCVLNAAEYGKHTQMCYTPPDKAPGRCPSCTSDGQCCDRLGAEGAINRCIGGRCCGPDGPARPGTPTVIDTSCCSGVRYAINSPIRQCAPPP